MKKSKLGMTSVHAAAANQNCFMLKQLLSAKSVAEIEKAISAEARFAPDATVEYNPISYLVHQDVQVPKLTNTCFRKLKASSRIPGVAFNACSLADMGDTFLYLLHTCCENDIAVPEKMTFVPKEEKEKLSNYALYSHLFSKTPKVSTTLLHFAVLLGNIRMALYLLGLGLSIDAKDSEGRTPLMYAVLTGRLRTVELLLNRHNKYLHEQKVNINAADRNGRTALLYCLERMEGQGKRLVPMRADIVRVLIQSGASVGKKDEDGMTFADCLGKLPGNEAYVDVVRKLEPGLKVKENSVQLAQDTRMHVDPRFDFAADCEAYLEKKMKKLGTAKKDEGVKVDPLSTLQDKAEVVKGDQ